MSDKMGAKEIATTISSLNCSDRVDIVTRAGVKRSGYVDVVRGSEFAKMASFRLNEIGTYRLIGTYYGDQIRSITVTERSPELTTTASSPFGTMTAKQIRRLRPALYD